MHNPKNITPAKRVVQYRGEPFVVSGGKLFRQVCRKELALKNNIIDNYVKHFKKHTVDKQKLAGKGTQKKNIAEALITNKNIWQERSSHQSTKCILLKLKLHFSMLVFQSASLNCYKIY